MSNFINLTPHALTLRCREGVDTHIAPSGTVARVRSTPGVELGSEQGILLCSAPTFGAVEGLPEPIPGTIYIVSGMVAARCLGRTDVFSPGTGPQDGAIREGGRIVAVTRLLRAPK